MDCRIDPAELLGFDVGDAHVIRNAGGIVTDDVLRSLALSQNLLETQDVVIIQHTNCGLHGDEAEIRGRLGDEPAGPLHAFESIEESVREGLARLREASYLTDRARGFVYEVESGRLREITDG